MNENYDLHDPDIGEWLAIMAVKDSETLEETNTPIGVHVCGEHDWELFHPSLSS